MSTEKTQARRTSSPQYFIINKSEPQYELIKKQLLETTVSHPGSSRYFIHAGENSGSVCRIRAVNGTVLFYEILNHQEEGISDEEIREVLVNPANASPLPEYYYVTPQIEQKLRTITHHCMAPGRTCPVHPA